MKATAEMTYEDEPLTSEEEELILAEQISAFGTTLQRLAEDRVSRRADIERRWILDLYQYNGQYDPETKAKLDGDDNKSSVFVNITRPKTNTVEARLVDMLFPTDDKNWGISPTPVPEVTGNLQNRTPLQGGGTASDLAKRVLAEAAKRAAAMETEIDDQLKECKYNIESRDMIHDACVLGTGIIKAPLTVGKTRRAWKPIGTDSAGVDQYQMEQVDDPRPIAQHVSLWDFFPDMDVPGIEDGESTLERHYYTRRQVRDLLKMPGFIEGQVRALLLTEPKEYHTTNSHVEQLRTLSGLNSVVDDRRYEIWEYYGPIDKDDLIACGCAVDENDPMQEYEGVVWFCGPIVLKASINPNDSGYHPYSVFCWEKDDTSVFGFGFPYQLRNTQRVVNAAWRMILDNGGLSVGPQTVINRKVIEPADGSWDLKSRKVWYLTNANARVGDAFGAFDIPSRQVELSNILTTAMQLADEETAMPIIAQGDSAPHIPDTVGGMTMLMNNSNAIIRRVVKSYDDDITVPVIGRYYDWNMQFSSKNEIKGDFEIVARGTSALLVKEQQQQFLTQFMQLTANPLDAKFVKRVEGLRKVVQAGHITADDLILTDEEIKQAQENEKPSPPPELLKAQLEYRMHQEKMKDAEAERQTRLLERQMEREVALIKLANEKEISIADLTNQLKATLVDAQVKRANFVDEANLKASMGEGI